MNHMIEPGNIMILKGDPNQPLSRCIMYLTDSDVSHSTMIINDHQIVHLIAGGVTYSDVEFHPGSSAYMLRLRNAPDCTPLLQAARAYYDAETRYDYSALLTLAPFLISRRFLPNGQILGLIDRLLQKLILALDDALNKGHHKAMVCSQFIFQVFLDCGSDYTICLDNFPLPNDLTPNGSGTALSDLHTEDGTICLLDLLSSKYHSVLSVPPVDSVVTVTQLRRTPVQESDEVLIGQLADALCPTDFSGVSDLSKTHNPDSSRKPDDSYSEYTSAQLMQTTETAAAALAMLHRYHDACCPELAFDSLFITPADILNHSTNLDLLGTIHMTH